MYYCMVISGNEKSIFQLLHWTSWNLNFPGKHWPLNGSMDVKEIVVFPQTQEIQSQKTASPSDFVISPSGWTSCGFQQGSNSQCWWMYFVELVKNLSFMGIKWKLLCCFRGESPAQTTHRRNVNETYFFYNNTNSRSNLENSFTWLQSLKWKCIILFDQILKKWQQEGIIFSFTVLLVNFTVFSPESGLSNND